MLSQPMMDSGGKAECWSRWSIEEALLVRDPPASPGNLCSQEMERALFWNPSCATYEPSIDGEERLSPSHNMWLTRDFRGGGNGFTRSTKLMAGVCRRPMSVTIPRLRSTATTNTDFVHPRKFLLTCLHVLNPISLSHRSLSAAEKFLK